MDVAEDDPRWKYWYQFMKKKAGLPRSFCLDYASKFTDNDVKVDQLTEAVKDVLEFLGHVGVDKAGHSMRIRTEAKKLGCSTALTEEVELLKIEEDGEDVTGLDDGRSSMVEGEEEDETWGEDGGSSMAAENSPSPVTVRQVCNHAQSEKCLNCIFCDKHVNIKSLPRHIHNKHKIKTVPVTNKRSKPSTLTPAPEAGGQSSSAVQSSDDEESGEDAIAIVPPLSEIRRSNMNTSGTVQGLVRATGKDAGWKLLNVKVKGKKPVKKVKVTGGVEPLLLRAKKAVLNEQSGTQPSSHEKVSLSVKKLRQPQWLVVDPKSKSSQKVSKSPAKKNELATAKPPLDRKVLGISDFVTGASRFGRMRKSKKIQSY